MNFVSFRIDTSSPRSRELPVIRASECGNGGYILITSLINCEGVPNYYATLDELKAAVQAEISAVYDQMFAPEDTSLQVAAELGLRSKEPLTMAIAQGLLDADPRR